MGAWPQGLAKLRRLYAQGVSSCPRRRSGASPIPDRPTAAGARHGHRDDRVV